MEGALIRGLGQEHIGGPEQVVPVGHQVNICGTLLVHMRAVIVVDIVQVCLRTVTEFSVPCGVLV